MSVENLENGQSSVCVDGHEVKRLREAQKLTQLYVSKVVGVATDTVSRWENNRYPTIRRDNALKLAGALEVPLEAILRKPEPGPAVQPNNRRFVVAGVAVLVLVAILALILVFQRPQISPLPAASVTAQRILPEYAAPASTIPVMVELTHRAASSGFIMREYFPKGWKLVQAFPPASSLDNINGVARWIIKSGEERDRIVYLLQVDPAVKAAEQDGFQGEVIIGTDQGQAAVPILGDTRLRIAPVHWADSNGDGQIDDVEMLQASYTIEDMAGVHIDWNHLESLWDAGSYRWDKNAGKFVPVTRAPTAQ